MEGSVQMKKLFDLTGKTAIITGGGRGLGKQIAFALAEAGARVVLCSRKLDACQAASEELQKMGRQALALACDVTQPADIEHVVKETVTRFGTIDILVNNSGISWVAPALELAADKWDKVMNVNVKAVFLFSQAAAKEMVKSGGGKIINIASVTGFGGSPASFMDTIAYNTSKGAVITFTKDLAVKLAPHNIQVNAIAPGFFQTKITEGLRGSIYNRMVEQIPQRRFGSDQDLKGAAVFLASGASDYVTGHILVVDGGISAQV
ncbi:SDR family oxidoreductase [Aneurinibacillus sp. BA2021]|nr:SDR family oxidoreductase [Aneurinibacillus sp. BA2021]